MSLQTLPADLLQPLKSLLKRSAIQEPPASQEIFSSLVADLRVYLANNFLTQLPSVLFDLSNLRVLSLRHNNLTEIPSAIGRLVNLETLNVSNNKLRYLPYEIMELFRDGNLLRLTAEPNPLEISTKSEFVVQTSPIIIHSAADPSIDEYNILKVAERTPEYFHHDGTRLHNLRTESKVVGEGLISSRVPSLVETALLECRKLPYLADLPETLSNDVTENVCRLLTLTRDVHHSGGRRCTTCHREMIVPRKHWIEWWSILGRSHRRKEGAFVRGIPFLRRQCGLACQEMSQKSMS